MSYNQPSRKLAIPHVFSIYKGLTLSNAEAIVLPMTTKFRANVSEIGAEAVLATAFSNCPDKLIMRFPYVVDILIWNTRAERILRSDIHHFFPGLVGWRCPVKL